jgi:uncharacterized protein YecT (DUF1311 family)
MRLLRLSLVLAASALQWACADDARTETAAAHARDSALSHDLAIAGYGSAAVLPRGRDTSASTRVPPMVERGASSVATQDSSTPAMTESAGSLATADPADAPSAASASARNASNASAPSAEGYVGPSCASPAPDDQQRCLRGYLARSDLGLDRRYQAMIRTLRLEAGTNIGDPDPLIVKRLRATQRAWLVFRDDACRKRTAASEGPLWAPVRAECLAEYSVQREREFDDALAERQSKVTKSTPTKPKAAKQTKRTSAKRRSRR